jgi:hypothetical protein
VKRWELAVATAWDNTPTWLQNIVIDQLPRLGRRLDQLADRRDAARARAS